MTEIMKNNLRVREKLTIIIKTFERRKSLERLLFSIEDQGYESVKIIILDDSKKDYKNKILNKFKKLKITYLVTEFDIGLSEGRNRLLKLVETPYFLLCDDDFKFDKRIRLEENLEIILQKKIDILCGKVYDRKELSTIYEVFSCIKHPNYILDWILKREKERTYSGIFRKEKDKLILEIDPKGIHLKKYDIGLNFFIGNVEKIKNIGGWDSYLKLGEHEEFFFRAKKNNLNVYYSDLLITIHFPVKTFNYMKYRKRSGIYQNNWLKNYNLKYFYKIQK